MVHMCGRYLQRFCPETRFYTTNNKLYRDIHEGLPRGIYQYVRKLCIKEQAFRPVVLFLRRVGNEFRSLKSFVFSGVDISEPEFSSQN